MSFESMIADVIVKSFNKNFGKFQSKKEDPKVMVVSFKVSLESGEEGYRYEDIALFAEYNYVNVYLRKRWVVISENDLKYDEETDDSYIIDGKDYDKGSSNWELLISHDSVWRSCINEYLFNNRNRIIGFDNSFNEDIYTSIKPADLKTN